MNPLHLDEVIETTFKYLDSHSLKTCRLVCQKWNELATKALLEQAFLHNFYEDVQADDCKSLRDFIATYGIKSFRNLHIRGLSILNVYKALGLLGPQVEKLKFYRLSLKPGKESAEELSEILGSLPRLKCLHMDLNEYTEKLFDEYSCYGSNAYRELFRLQEIQLRSFDSLSRRTLENLIKIPWQLTKLEITVDNRVPTELIRALLTKMSSTLQNLNLYFSYSYEGYDYDVSNPTEDNWIVPTSLRSLRKLKIGADRGNDSQILARSLVAALQLPELRVLKLYGEAAEGVFGKMVFPKMWDIQSSSLECLKFGSSFYDTSCFTRPISIWPNIKEITLYFPALEVLASVLSTMENLEKLHLELKNDKGIQWDAVLTGIRCPRGDFKHRQEELIPSTRASVRNLRRLKSLKIEFPEFSPGFYFTDFFIYNGLMYLTELQYLYIRGEKFSEKALEDLRRTLRPLCQINLVKCEMPDDYEYMRLATL
jgi:hypothetical protein